MIDAKEGHTLATIKVPQDKELLVGVSAEIGLVTFGSGKGRYGGSGQANRGSSNYRNSTRPLCMLTDLVIALPAEPTDRKLSKVNDAAQFAGNRNGPADQSVAS